MDNLNYGTLLKSTLTEFVELSGRQQKPDVETILIADEQRGHYLWLKLGWEDGKRVKYIIVYVRLRDGKFWIEEDWTEEGIATELVRSGVPQDDIVLAFKAPEERHMTGFAVA